MPPTENQNVKLFIVCDQFENCEKDHPDKECWCLFPHYEGKDFEYTCFPSEKELTEIYIDIAILRGDVTRVSDIKRIKP